MRRKTVEVSERTMRYYNRSINKNNKDYIRLFKLHNNLRKQLKAMTDSAYFFSNYNNYYYTQYTTLLNNLDKQNIKMEQKQKEEEQEQEREREQKQKQEQKQEQKEEGGEDYELYDKWYSI